MILPPCRLGLTVQFTLNAERLFPFRTSNTTTDGENMVLGRFYLRGGNSEATH